MSKTLNVFIEYLMINMLKLKCIIDVDMDDLLNPQKIIKIHWNPPEIEIDVKREQVEKLQYLI